MRGFRRLLVVVVATLLPACSFPGNVSEQTARYMTEVAESANQELLLNIVRASLRHPMHFTALTQLRGGGTIQGTGSLSFPFGRETRNPFIFTPGLTFSNAPTFDLGVLSSKEFINGMLTPIPAQTVDYYLNRNYPDEMLWHLFIEQIDVDDRPHNNHPIDATKFGEFTRVLKDLLNCGLSTARSPDETKFGPPLAESEVRSLKYLTEVAAGGLVLSKQNDGQYQLLRRKQEARYCFKDDLGNEKALCVAKRGAPKADVEALTTNATGTLGREARIEFGTAGTTSAACKIRPKSVTLYARSTEGIIAYLGEIVRSQTRSDGPHLPILNLGDDNRPEWKPIFIVRTDFTPEKDLTAGRNLTTVEYLGRKYAVPLDHPSEDRSAQIMGLVTLLMSQFRSSSDLPKTGAVTVVNPP